MTLEIAVPVWGVWVKPWLDYAQPLLREVPDSRLVVYTRGEDADRLRGSVDEIRPIQSGNGFGPSTDAADWCHADILDRALAERHPVAPLTASHIVARGSFPAALVRLGNGRQAVVSLHLTSSRPDNGGWTNSPEALARWAKRIDVFTEWDRTPSFSHPGFLSWRAGDSWLVRMVYTPPLVIVPTRAHRPVRAIDHFMIEGYLDSPDQVAYASTGEAMTVGLPAPGATQPCTRQEMPDTVMGVNGFVAWARNGNAQRWNVCEFLRQKYWLGEPDLDVEDTSDRVVAEIVRAYG